MAGSQQDGQSNVAADEISAPLPPPPPPPPTTTTTTQEIPIAHPNENENQEDNNDLEATIEVKNLTYTFPDGTVGLRDVNLELPKGSRCLLVGANGAGKTTLLRLLSGRRLPPPDSTLLISHLSPFSTPVPGITFLGSDWILNPIVRTDISVPELLSSVGGNAYPSRRDALLKILDIDVRWRMHAVSDGERRRVQLAMGLVRPWKVLLLDEVTVDLDLVTRVGFLEWLKRETMGVHEGGREATVVYATHIFDGLGRWPDWVVHVAGGGVRRQGRVEEFVAVEGSDGGGREDAGSGGAGAANGMSPLSALVLRWLKEDMEARGPRPDQELDEHGKSQPRSKTGMDGSSSEAAKSEGAGAGFGGYGFESRSRREQRIERGG